MTPNTRRPLLPLFIPTVLLLLLLLAGLGNAASSDGRWDVLNGSTGVSAMHMQLLRGDLVVFFDRTDFGKSGLPLPDGRCRDDPRDLALKHDCTAHAAQYDVSSGSVRPLMILTDTWCSSGTVAPDGTLVQTGGYNDGDRAARTLRPGPSRDWVENPTALAVRRWYATSHVLPDGTAVIVGGRRQFSYEFYPTTSSSGGEAGTYDLPLLRETKDAAEDNLYPFVHLNVDGNLFVFANDRAILLDYKNHAVVRTFPTMPGGDPRNYPSSGSSVLLPLPPSGTEAEVLVCGGAPAGSFARANRGEFVAALDTCGRLRITDESPEWSMETMPAARVMGDMVLLPTGDVLVVNGAGKGTAGWEFGRDPVLSPVVYSPGAPPGRRFQVETPTTIPRLYHSTAVLLRDGRVLVGGSNPHAYYNFTGVPYPTDTSLEAFSPAYLAAGSAAFRPVIVSARPELGYGERFGVRFFVAAGLVQGGVVGVTMVLPSFTTHSFSMNQRLLVLQADNATTTTTTTTATTQAPNAPLTPASTPTAQARSRRRTRKRKHMEKSHRRRLPPAAESHHDSAPKRTRDWIPPSSRSSGSSACFRHRSRRGPRTGSDDGGRPTAASCRGTARWWTCGASCCTEPSWRR
uniref:Galactose oxidase n=1 Tax=Anthurium amnicola TaxID=1678845 RepID=A0A1D1ZAP1_9ARAE